MATDHEALLEAMDAGLAAPQKRHVGQQAITTEQAPLAERMRMRERLAVEQARANASPFVGVQFLQE